MGNTRYECQPLGDALHDALSGAQHLQGHPRLPESEVYGPVGVARDVTDVVAVLGPELSQRFRIDTGKQKGLASVQDGDRRFLRAHGKSPVKLEGYEVAAVSVVFQ